MNYNFLYLLLGLFVIAGVLFYLEIIYKKQLQSANKKVKGLSERIGQGFLLVGIITSPIWTFSFFYSETGNFWVKCFMFGGSCVYVAFLAYAYFKKEK